MMNDEKLIEELTDAELLEWHEKTAMSLADAKREVAATSEAQALARFAFTFAKCCYEMGLAIIGMEIRNRQRYYTGRHYLEVHRMKVALVKWLSAARSDWREIWK